MDPAIRGRRGAVRIRLRGSHRQTSRKRRFPFAPQRGIRRL